MPPTLDALLAGIKQRQNAALAAALCHCPAPAEAPDNADATHYANQDRLHGIDFRVERLALGGLQVMDPRLVRIAPGACNECHRHAHESLFVTLAGEGELRIGEDMTTLRLGDVACVPRWVPHQSRNTSPHEDLLLLAITDFGLTSAVLGDYDAQTRQRSSKAHGHPSPTSAASAP